MKTNLSLIICAKNEAGRIGGLLRSVVPQSHDEIVFVLDRCTDNTRQIIESFDLNCRTKIIELQQNEWQNAPKKFALLKGIQSAENDLMIFTDADCELKDNHFEVYRSLFPKYEVIVGLSIPEKEPENLAETLHLIDFLWTAGLYSFFTKIGLPYMSVGRNWGFNRRLFEENFLSSHNHILSGDDDLLFQQLLTKKPKVALNDLVNVNTNLMSSFQQIFVQKTRHLKTGISYQLNVKLQLAFLSLTEVAGLTGTVTFLMLSDYKSAVFCLIFPAIIYSITYQSISRFMFRFQGTKMSLIKFSMLKPVHTFLLLVLSVFSLRKRNKWN